MKKRFNLLLLILFFVQALPVIAQDDKPAHERKRYAQFKERTISKTYPASGNSLSVENSFGDVKVTTWDRNEIKIDIHIEASSDNKEIAEKTFNAISVSDAQNGNKITFKTEHKDVRMDDCKNCNSSMSIDYDIKMPAGNTLAINNSFGNIVLPDYNGTVSLTSKFGSLNTGRLQKVETLMVEFNRDVQIKSVSNIDATFKFSKVNIDQLGGSNKINMEFCSLAKISLGSDLSSLTIKESYSTLNLLPASGLSATYTIATSFGSVVDRANIGLKRTDEEPDYGPDFDKNYEGKSGSGAAKIDAKSSFGKIIIGEPTADDLKKKSKEKTTRV